MSHVDAQAARTYDAIAEAYVATIDENERPYNSLYERPGIIAMLPDVANKRVLDVGCGSGPLSAWLASRGAEVVGFDASSKMISIARRRNILGATFHVADLAQPLEFLADGSFDVVVASLVMHYLHDWCEPLRELRRVLHPRGSLVFSTHHPAMDLALSESGNYFDIELITDTWDLAGDAHEVRFWRRPLSDMFAAFQTAGLRVVAFREPQPLEECRDRFPEAWTALTTQPRFAFFALSPATA